MPKVRGPKQVMIMKEHGDTGDSFAAIMKNTRDLNCVHTKMVEIARVIKDCTHFMRIMSKLLISLDPEDSYLHSLANWMDFEVGKCFDGIDIKQNILGLYEYQDVSAEVSAFVDVRYNMLMDSFSVMNLIYICKILSPYKQYLCTEEEETITHASGRKTTKKIIKDLNIERDAYDALATRFFNFIPGSMFKPFAVKTVDELLSKLEGESTILGNHIPETSAVVRGCREIDLKQLYIDHIDDKDYKYALMLSCAKLYVRTYRVSQSIRIPDMDPSKLRRAIESGLERYKHERVIQNNASAYHELCDSVAMLEENFDEYYNGYVKTGNLTNIFEQYVVDVAEEKKDKKHMKVQFSRIIQFFKMKAAPMIKNSNSVELKKLFNTADKKFSSFLSEAEQLEADTGDDAPETDEAGPSMIESLRQQNETPILETVDI
jgi:hypothetical protein